MVCKSLKRRIYVSTQDDSFVQCVSPITLREELNEDAYLEILRSLLSQFRRN
ncbi:hypothetical protein [Nostoc sp.]